jgi:hypothetical protein
MSPDCRQGIIWGKIRVNVPLWDPFRYNSDLNFELYGECRLDMIILELKVIWEMSDLDLAANDARI